MRRAERDRPGLVHVISAMESCPGYKPWLGQEGVSEILCVRRFFELSVG